MAWNGEAFAWRGALTRLTQVRRDVHSQRVNDWKDRFAELMGDRRSSDSFDEAQRLKSANLPAKLFKYCPPSEDPSKLERRLGIIRGLAWLSPPESFNDPLDCTIAYDARADFKPRFRPRNEDARPSSKLWRMVEHGETLFGSERLRDFTLADLGNLAARFLDPRLRKATAALRQNLGVTCFSESVTSAPMWAHYGGFHQGFCLEWSQESWLRDPASLARLFPVFYDETPFRRPDLGLNPVGPHSSLLLTLRKSSDWSYEREWRYVHKLDTEQRLHPIPKPTAVHIGYEMKSQVREIVLSSCRAEGLALYEMKCFPERGRLESVEIRDQGKRG